MSTLGGLKKITEALKKENIVDQETVSYYEARIIREIGANSSVEKLKKFLSDETEMEEIAERILCSFIEWAREHGSKVC